MGDPLLEAENVIVATPATVATIQIRWAGKDAEEVRQAIPGARFTRRGTHGDQRRRIN
jgi:hypothetical protein